MAKALTEKREQAGRLLHYLELLSRGQGIAVWKMAFFFHVREGAVYRDLRRLRALGYPLEGTALSARSDEVVYRFPLAWRNQVRKVELTVPEVESALLAVEQYCRLGPPHRLVQLAVGKLQALHAEAGPAARVRAWQGIVRRAGGIRTEGEVPGAVMDAVQIAISESRWCEVVYRPMATDEWIRLQFAPRKVADGTVFGASRDTNRWDVLNLIRMGEVILGERTEVGDEAVAAVDELVAETPNVDGAGEIWRVERQVLRLVAIVRMLGTGRTARPIELAEAFMTTLHTIRRDRDLLEQAGYSTLESGSELRNSLRGNAAFYGSIPPLPIAGEERFALIHTLERFCANYPASELVRGVISKFKEVGDPVVALTVSDAEHPEPDMLWELVEAMIGALPCQVVYGAHRGIHRLVHFTPEEFQVGSVLRVKGVESATGEVVILIVPDIVAVRVLRRAPGREAE